MTQDSRRRTGTLTFGSTTYNLMLAPRADAYEYGYETVWPQQSDVPGTDKTADTLTRTWHMTNWDGGEGNSEWVPGSNMYFQSNNVIPKPVTIATNGDLVLGPYAELTNSSTPAVFTEGQRLCLAAGNLYAGYNDTIHAWNLATDQWDAAGTATGCTAGHEICSMTDGSVAASNYVYVAYLNQNTIRRVVPGGGNAEWYAASSPPVTTGTFTYDPVLQTYDGRLFALDGDDLYEITAANTRSQVAETKTYSNTFLTGSDRQTYNRLCATDTGLAWYTVSDNGQVEIWDYNVPDDLDQRVGKLPVDGCYPYDIHWSNGYLFVAFRYSNRHTTAGLPYVYYQRGGQRGIAGPLRSPTTTASKPIKIAGTVGDDLFFFYNGYLWAYNYSAGAIICKAASVASTHTAVHDSMVWGKDIFVGNADNAQKVERFDTTAAYTTTSPNHSTGLGTLDSGRWDFGYKGILKTLLDVRVQTAPLPANTAVTMSVSADGDTFTSLSGTHNTAGATTYRWAASSYTSSLTGYGFELRIGLSTTASASTPTVRSITARAISANKRRVWQLLLDPSTFVGGQAGAAPRSADTLTDLRAVATTAGVALFTNPWDGEAWDTPSTHSVTVGDVMLTRAEPQKPQAVSITLWEVAYA